MRRHAMTGWFLLIGLVGILGMHRDASAAPRRRSVAPRLDQDTLLIGFTRNGTLSEVGQLEVDLPSGIGIGKSVRVRTEDLTVHVRRPSGVTGGTATLRAWLRWMDGRMKVRVNGRELTTTPLVLDTIVPIGSPIALRIEIAVPNTVDEQSLLTSIEWDVSSNTR